MSCFSFCMQRCLGPPIAGAIAWVAGISASSTVMEVPIQPWSWQVRQPAAPSAHSGSQPWSWQ
eukprot:5615772-Amphidinium_carterae.1